MSRRNNPNKGYSLGYIRKHGVCSTCSCIPCQCTDEQRNNTRRQNNADNYNQGKAQERWDRENPPPKKTKKTKKTKKKTAPSKSKAAFIRDFKKKHPTASDADVKKALKAAGYSVSCLVLVGFMAAITSGTGWGIYEGVRAIIS